MTVAGRGWLDKASGVSEGFGADYLVYRTIGGDVMKATFVKGVVLGAVVSSVTVISSFAFAGTGIGGVFNLGQSNSVNGSTVLTGSTTGSQLTVVNSSTAAGASGIGIHTATGKPPIAVNSATQVQNLNASYVGGVPATRLIHGTGSITGGSVAFSSGSDTNLGPVASFGNMTAYCGAGGFNFAGITFSAAKQTFIVVPGGSIPLGPGQTATIGSDAVTGIATFQFSDGTIVSSGSEVATATLTWVAQDPNCHFSAQVIDSNG